MGGERTLAQLSIYPSTAEYRDIHHSSVQGRSYTQHVASTRPSAWPNPSIPAQQGRHPAAKAPQLSNPRAWQPAVRVPPSKGSRPNDLKVQPTVLKGLRDTAVQARTYRQQQLEFQNKY